MKLTPRNCMANSLIRRECARIRWHRWVVLSGWLALIALFLI